MKYDPHIFADVLRELGYDAHKIRKIMLGEGYGHVAIAEATVPPRPLDERIERLRKAGQSLRTISGCPGMPSKSALSLRLSPEARAKHNNRPPGAKYRMRNEDFQILMSTVQELTAAIKGNDNAERLTVELMPLFEGIENAIFDAGCVVADAITTASLKTEAATRGIAVKLDTANTMNRR